jgi:excisionase family DNA binding protein
VKRPKETERDPKTTDDALVDPETVANHLGVARSTVYALIERRRVPAVRVGRVLRLRVSEVERALATAPAIGPAAPAEPRR